MTPITPQLVLRLALLAVTVVLLQIAAFSQVQILGVTADLLPLTVMAVALLCGSLTGATFGFFLGLCADMALVQTLGLSSLVYVAAGYAIGRARELRDPQGTLVPLVAGFAATTIALVGYAVMQFLLGVDAPVSVYLVRETLATIVLDTILAVPLYLVVRRWLLPALPDDPRRRRRRAYTTGGLSPLSRA
jgi:rod shape-determining protein MreD